MIVAGLVFIQPPGALSVVVGGVTSTVITGLLVAVTKALSVVAIVQEVTVSTPGAEEIAGKEIVVVAPGWIFLFTRGFASPTQEAIVLEWSVANPVGQTGLLVMVKFVGAVMSIR